MNSERKEEVKSGFKAVSSDLGDTRTKPVLQVLKGK